MYIPVNQRRFTKIKNRIKYRHSVSRWLFLCCLLIMAFTRIMTRIHCQQSCSFLYFFNVLLLHLINFVCISHKLLSASFFPLMGSINQKRNRLSNPSFQDTFSARTDLLKWQVYTSMNLQSILQVQWQSYHFNYICIWLVAK